MHTLTDIDKQFIDAIRAAVKEKGEDYVYPDELRDGGQEAGSCQYTVDGEGACIVGKAIQIATGEPFEGANTGAHAVLPNYGVSYDVVMAFDMAQKRQDFRGTTWGEALEYFENELCNSGIDYPPVDISAQVS